jgi:hypothetical protein
MRVACGVRGERVCRVRRYFEAVILFYVGRSGRSEAFEEGRIQLGEQRGVFSV